MIRGYNFPSSLGLHTISNEATFDFKTFTFEGVNSYTVLGKLYDDSKLYYKITKNNRVTFNTTNYLISSTGLEGNIVLVKPNGNVLTIDFPSYTIPNRHEVGNDKYDYYEYDYGFYCPKNDNIYLRIQRHYYNKDALAQLKGEQIYSSIYKLNISENNLSWDEKAIEIAHNGTSILTNFIIEDDYIYAMDRTNIYACKYNNTTSQSFKTVVNISNNLSKNIYFFKKTGTNKYLCYNYNAPNLFNGKWVCITRNSDETYTISSGEISNDTSSYNKQITIFTLNENEEIYAELFGMAWEQKGIQYYKLKSDFSDWELQTVEVPEHAYSNNTDIRYYIDNTPDFIFTGRKQTGLDRIIVRSDGTFDLTIFPVRNSLEYKKINEPKIENTLRLGWSLQKYVSNGKNQEAFFFHLKMDENDSLVGAKCVLKSTNNIPVLYSTFTNSSLTTTTPV